MSTLWSTIKKNNEIYHIDLRILNSYFVCFLYYIVFLYCFLVIQYIYSCLLVLILLSQKLSLFIEILTSTWALDTLSLQRNICQNMRTSDITLSHKNLSHLTILEGNTQAKPFGLEFQIPQVLCKSTKSVRIRARILMAESFSWNSFTYMYMY